MAWDEAKTWLSGSTQGKHYQSLLEEASEAPKRNAQRRKVVHPDEMPWEMSRQGLLKHLLNAAMNTRMETVDAYMQIIPPGSRSGKHRHLAEECLYVVEGRGYDLHGGRQALDLSRNGAALGLTDSKLAEPVIAPAPDASVFQKGAGVQSPEDHGRGPFRNPLHGHGYEAVFPRGRVAELPVRVPAPAQDPAGKVHGACVIAPSLDGRDSGRTRHLDRQGAVVIGSGSELSMVVLAPAVG